MKIVKIERDSDLQNPCDDGGWRLYSFSRCHASYSDPDNFTDHEAKIEAGVAFILSYYEHSGCVWSLRGEGPQCRWDSVDTAGILVWEGDADDLAPDYATRRAYAAGFLTTYTAWCNGDGYGYSIDEEVTHPCGHVTREGTADSCWGFYGPDTDCLIDAIRDDVGRDDYRVEGECAYVADGVDLRRPLPTLPAPPAAEPAPVAP